ncbi:2'-deoxynucleoside 5'-phosphate N-hydrolase 1-like [Limulus polyphemus]|uniref:Putative 2'-deoxynucleoside 5'-phosphate N-hydrolase 1 n=1 Tax=Limulus polyphemus TaxID=6850 RepID=A0ABM1AZU0_LIMPO|nr:2'-deoxynucleoside 5'-phosphate N-hydrolase 1-like [Limulus polyphemus]XP_022238582.1 2'-deoxynucleoside 5'-phosphate N-hydrolase 1-like [Limulus polyphemus]XP_022238583.1 2'-deoxynucleoside 5'-phosphate N-hydrolase 1-like [Limulus polyphemus]
MKFEIYFCGSIRAGRQDAEIYRRIISKLKKYGTVLTEFVGTNDDSKEGESHTKERELSDSEIHERDIRLLEQCEALVAEVTQPSLGVGYEVGRAVVLKKPILCLFRPSCGKILSALIRGIHNEEDIIIKDYKESDLDDTLQEFFEKVQKMQEKNKK